MQKVVFLDRDGTINVDSGYVHRVEDWVFTESAEEGLKMLQDDGFVLAIITNQSGIGHGLYSLGDMEKVHEHMRFELEKAGVSLDAIAYCPHRRDAGCECRKPMTGMAKKIEEKVGEIDYANSWTVGDKTADLIFGKRLGTKTALIKSRYWQREDLEQEPDLIAESLYGAALKIVDHNP